MADMNGQVALVTGGIRGIGLAIGERLMNRGVRVAAGYSSHRDDAQLFADKYADHGVTIHQGNIGSNEDCVRVIGEVLEQHGQLDILVNNAGITVDKTVRKMTPEEWDRVMAINLKSCFFAMKHVIPVMEKQGGGSIVNISSIAGIRYTGVPHATYYASKAAMNHLTRTTAVPYAPKRIRVNAILPGLMETPMVLKSARLATAYGGEEELWKARARQVPMGFGGNAWDVAYGALYLASDESRYVTGIQLVVDGGVTLKYA